VDYQGRSYRPEDLERGDRIAADVDRAYGRLYAQDIQVLYDVSGYDNGAAGQEQGAPDLQGVVRYVDTRNRTLEIEPEYDTPTPGGGPTWSCTTTPGPPSITTGAATHPRTSNGGTRCGSICAIPAAGWSPSTSWWSARTSLQVERNEPI
jgi:hypothetical protein